MASDMWNSHASTPKSGSAAEQRNFASAQDMVQKDAALGHPDRETETLFGCGRSNPDAWVLYVDNDTMVCSYAPGPPRGQRRSSGNPGRSGHLKPPRAIRSRARIDFTRPVGLLRRQHPRPQLDWADRAILAALARQVHAAARASADGLTAEEARQFVRDKIILLNGPG